MSRLDRLQIGLLHINVARGPVVGTAAALLAAALWGTAGLFVTFLAQTGMEAPAMASYRMAVAFLAGAVWLALRNPRLLRIRREDVGFVVLFGCVGLAPFSLLYTQSMILNGMTMATFLLYVYPAMVFVMARVALGEGWTAAKLGGLVISLIGVAFLSGILGGAQWHLVGTIVGLLAPICIALATVLGKLAAGRIAPTTLVVYGTGFAGLLLFPVTLLFFGGLPALAVPGGFAPLLLLGMGLLPGLFAPVLLMWSLRWLDAGTSSVICLLEPVTAVVLAWLVFGEGLTPIQWVGAALILGGAALVQKLRFPVRGIASAEK